MTKRKAKRPVQPTIKQMIGAGAKPTYKTPSASQISQKMVVLIRFIKAYQKPSNQGGRVLRKDSEYFVTLEMAEKYVSLGVAEAVIQFIPKVVVAVEEETKKAVAQEKKIIKKQ